MSETIEITLPKEIMEKAKERGVDIEKFKTAVKTFALLDLTARASKLSKREANSISKRIKASAWKKVKKNLNL
jgi:hypothetical protein